MMERLIPLVVAGMIGLAGLACGDADSKAKAGEACDGDGDCDKGLVCEGCNDDHKECITGCREDEDCESGECHVVDCFGCPCPPLCSGG